jgi:hypothetical protein
VALRRIYHTYHGLATLVLGNLVLGIGVVDFVHNQGRIGNLLGHPADVLLLRLRHDDLVRVVAARRLLLPIGEAQRQAKVEWVTAQRGAIAVGRRCGVPCWYGRAGARDSVEIPPHETGGEEDEDEGYSPRRSAKHGDG